GRTAGLSLRFSLPRGDAPRRVAQRHAPAHYGDARARVRATPRRDSHRGFNQRLGLAEPAARGRAWRGSGEPILPDTDSARETSGQISLQPPVDDSSSAARSPELLQQQGGGLQPARPGVRAVNGRADRGGGG